MGSASVLRLPAGEAVNGETRPSAPNLVMHRAKGAIRVEVIGDDDPPAIRLKPAAVGGNTSGTIAGDHEPDIGIITNASRKSDDIARSEQPPPKQREPDELSRRLLQIPGRSSDLDWSSLQATPAADKRRRAVEDLDGGQRREAERNRRPRVRLKASPSVCSRRGSPCSLECSLAASQPSSDK